MQVVVDSREASKAVKVMSVLKQHVEDLKVEVLEYGDYLVGNVLFERSTYSDFLGKLREGRLFDQLKGLKSFEGTSALILEGSFMRAMERSSFSTTSVAGLLSSIVVDWQVPLIPSHSPVFTAQIIYTTARRLSGEKREYEIRFKPRLESLDEKVLFLTASLPQVGSLRAKKLLNHFKSFRNLIVNAEKINEVEGIGEKIKQAVVEVVDYEWKG